MYEYMSMRILSVQYEPSLAILRRRFWAGVFARAIEHNRQARGLSLEDAARLAGLETSQWAAFEAGAVPRTDAELYAIAGTLEIGCDQLFNLVLLCRDAWEV